MMVVDPSSRLERVTVVWGFPGTDVVEVTDEGGPAFSDCMPVVLDGVAGVWATTGSGDSKTRTNSGMMGFISNQMLGRLFVRVAGLGHCRLGESFVATTTSRWPAPTTGRRELQTNLRLSAELVRRLDLGPPLGPAGLLVPARLAALAPQAVLACLAYPTA